MIALMFLHIKVSAYKGPLRLFWFVRFKWVFSIIFQGQVWQWYQSLAELSAKTVNKVNKFVWHGTTLWWIWKWGCGFGKNCNYPLSYFPWNSWATRMYLPLDRGGSHPVWVGKKKNQTKCCSKSDEHTQRCTHEALEIKLLTVTDILRTTEKEANFQTRTKTLKNPAFSFLTKNCKRWCVWLEKPFTTFALMSTPASALNYLAVRMGNEHQELWSHLGNAAWWWGTGACHIIINKRRDRSMLGRQPVSESSPALRRKPHLGLGWLSVWLLGIQVGTGE